MVLLSEEIYMAKPMATQKAPAAKDLKQQTIPCPVKKKLVLHQLMVPEVKEDRQWKGVEFLLIKCLPFNTVEKKGLQRPSETQWTSEHWSKMENR
jgi:hypothetical protein